jgi:uncharacterized protein YdaU (DUF1376 family)
MHYYQFNIGDYASHTRHLNLLEDLAYRRLLDIYYLQERPLNTGIASVARQINMRDHETEVKAVLEEFFEFTDDGWINRRADQEIAKYQEFIAAGKRGAAKRWAKAAEKGGESDANREANTPPNATPIVNNKHKTITNIKDIRPEDVDISIWKDFVAHRKAKTSPITETVLKTIRTEADKAGWKMQDALIEMCSRGWTGFKADWVKGKVEAVPEWKLRIK